jgi:hypothetical protein
MFRDFRKDPLKSTAEILKALTIKCHCGKPLTKYKGPGEQQCCRECQKNLKEYGGTGVIGVKHSHGKLRCCAKCGYTPELDPENIAAANGDALHLNTIMRGCLEVDHIDGDHWNEKPENKQTLCVLCHRKKTMGQKDYLRKKVVLLGDETDEIVEEPSETAFY